MALPAVWVTVAVAAWAACVAALPAHVLIVGIDGLGGDWFDTADAPNMQALARAGTSTVLMQVRLSAVQAHTYANVWGCAHGWQDVLGASSSQNWFSMIGGSGPDQHGVYDNGWQRGDSDLPPTIFALLRAARGTTARIGCVYHWGGIDRLVEDDAPDYKAGPGDERDTTAAAVAYIRGGVPDLLFVHLDNVDAGGHAAGWGSTQYYRSIEVADELVGDLLSAYDAMGARGNLTVLISSDHGGTASGAHGYDRKPVRSIPFVMSGVDVSVGVVVEREVRVFDVAATAARLLGVTPPPSWIASPVYEAFDDYATPPKPARGLAYVLTTQYAFLYDTTGENGSGDDHSVWRPVAPPGYIILGDVVVRGRARPTFATPVFVDDTDSSSGSSPLAPPAAFERIWTNTDFGKYTYPVTYWQPIPQYGYTCVGTWAATSLPSATEPARTVLRCVHSDLAIKASTAVIAAVARNSGKSTLEEGENVSLWEADRAAGFSANSFIVRRDPDGPGYNKFYYLAL
jgi:hypothetical protein